MRRVPDLFFSKEVLSFGIVGVLSTLTHLGVLSLLVEGFAFSPVGANFFAFGASLAVSFVLNHHFTFRSPKRWRETFPRYSVTVLIGLGINQSVMWLFTEALHFSYLYGFAAVTVLVPVSNFLLHKYWTFAAEPPA
jgi:putative flippase GtrA